MIKDQKYFVLSGRYLDFDGKRFGEVSGGTAIAEFHGARRITSLVSRPRNLNDFSLWAVCSSKNIMSRFRAWEGKSSEDASYFDTNTAIGVVSPEISSR